MSFEEFQDGDHLGYRNGTILAISESLCHCDASHQVSAQSDLGFRRCILKNFKMAALPGSHLGHQNRKILIILNLCVTVMPPIKFQLNRT